MFSTSNKENSCKKVLQALPSQMSELTVFTATRRVLQSLLNTINILQPFLPESSKYLWPIDLFPFSICRNLTAHRHPHHGNKLIEDGVAHSVHITRVIRRTHIQTSFTTPMISISHQEVGENRLFGRDEKDHGNIGGNIRVICSNSANHIAETIRLATKSTDIEDAYMILMTLMMLDQ